MLPRMPSSVGLNRTSPPKALIISTRSFDTPAGITAMNRSPNWAHTIAMAMLVEPLDASQTSDPGPTSPRRHSC